MPNKSAQISVAIVMGSRSDWETLQHTASTLSALKIPHLVEVVSAHRTPDKMYAFAKAARAQGFKYIIAGAGGAAALPGMLAAMTEVPVLGVPIPTASLSGLDSLYSIVQMPGGIPVATFAIGKPGAINAALFAAAALSNSDPKIHAALVKYRSQQTGFVLENADPRQPLAPGHNKP